MLTMLKFRSISLTEEQKQSVIKLLNRDLANLYSLRIKIQKSYRGVVGSRFRILHQLWEEENLTLTKKIDQTAQRIRALGGVPITTLKEFAKHSTIKEQPDNLPHACAMSQSDDYRRAA